MKMNFKYVTMLACAALMAGFTSCSKDDEVAVEGLLPNGEMTTARFTLSQEGIATRANAAPSAAEQTIKSATLYVFDKSQKLEKAIQFTGLNNPAVGSATSQKVEITSGGHYFLAAVNAPTVSVTEGTSTLNDVEKTLINVAAIANITTGTNGFFMTNKDGAVSKNLATSVVNNIEIKVGRAMGKVVVACSGGANATSLTGTNGNLKEVKTVVANNPNKMHFFPVVESGIYKAPYYAETAVDESRYFPALKWTDSYATITGMSVVPGTNAYLMENANQTVRKGNTSYLLVSGKYVPSALRNKDNTASAVLPADGTFYRLYNVNNDEYYQHYIVAAKKEDIDPKKFTDDAKTVANGGKAHTVNVIKYAEGICYYAFPLENRNNVAPVSPFTTKRNVYYDVTLDRVTNAGASVPNINGNNDGNNTPDDQYIPGTGGGDGGGNNNNSTDKGGKPDPLEGKCEIQGTISVLPWDVVTQNGGIGY